MDIKSVWVVKLKVNSKLMAMTMIMAMAIREPASQMINRRPIMMMIINILVYLVNGAKSLALQPNKEINLVQCGCGCGGAPSLKVSRLGTPVNSKGNLLIDVNGSLQSWITERNVTVYAPFPENLRCIISGPSECGKTVLLKNLFIPGIQFDRLNIIGPTGIQYNDLEYRYIVFIRV